MGSLTRAALATLPQAVSEATAASVAELFAVGRALYDSPALVRALGDDSADKKATAALVEQVFGKAGAGTRKLFSHLVGSNWSRPADLLEGVEEAGIRLAAVTAKGDIAGELLSVDRVIKAQPDVQLALSGKRAPAEAKQKMVTALFGKAISAEALAIVSHLVTQPRNRRITESVTRAAAIVCDQRGEGLAEVRVAQAIGDAQLKTVSTMLDAEYGRPHYIDQVVDQGMVGGIRIRVGDHVMDHSVATQLADMRRQLAS
jgi:F-type H+-transporting ATPase subunit delta